MSENKAGTRLNYIDNLRWITVALLIIYHAAMAYNTWGEANYIFFEPVKAIASVVTFISPWFMPLMFALAGVSSKYSLQKRGYAVFIRERLIRLGIPLLAGIYAINPVLSFIADVTHNGYKGTYLSHYRVFFTEYTDFSGYDGGFAIAHLWFILVLLLISILSCAVISILSRFKTDTVLFTAVTGIVLFLLSALSFDIKTAGKPVLLYLCVYLTGYFIYGNESAVKRIARYKWVLLAVFIASSLVASFFYNYFYADHGNLVRVCTVISFLTGVPALITAGHDHLDLSNAFTRHNAGISYVVYIIHLPLLVVFQYYLSLAGISTVTNFFLSVLISYPVVYGMAFLIGRTRYLRLLFGLKVTSKKDK